MPDRFASDLRSDGDHRAHAIVELEHLSRRFGRTTALDEVSLKIYPSRVYGLVGANGQGKTTLIKHILGLLKAQHGSVSVWGFDPVKHPVEVLSRIGYLSEERDLPVWMRVDELLRYTGAFYPHWDAEYAAQLVRTFGLDPKRKVKHLSKGMKAQVGLIAAVSHRPELLLLDEPSTGLDAVVRQDILNTIVRTVADEGRTVIFSSHLLDEVEQMSDSIIMIDQGRLVLEGDLDTIKAQHDRLVVRLSDTKQSLPILPGVLSAEQHGAHWTVVNHRAAEGQAKDQAPTDAMFSAAGAEIVDRRGATLQEIFVARAGRERMRPDAERVPPPDEAAGRSTREGWGQAS